MRPVEDHSWFEYLYYVYFPLRRKRFSFSTYPVKSETRLQWVMWILLSIGTSVCGFHIYLINLCIEDRLNYLCSVITLSWVGYSVPTGFGLFIGMLLHYAYIPPSEIDKYTEHEDPLESDEE
jgi:hypothetical protein